MTTLVGTEMHLADALNHLIQLDYDAIEAYEAAIERLKNRDDKNRLESFMQDHIRHTENLAPFMRELGREPAQKADVKSFLTKGKVAVGDIAGDSGVLRAMRSNEEDTNTAYSRMTTRDDLSPDLQQILLENFHDEQRHLQWIERRLGTGEEERENERVDEAAEESFPASDPPSFTPVSHPGPPKHKRE